MEAAQTPFLRSTIGLKVVMAATGAALLGFVTAHLAGNLQVFAGAETFNAYAHWIKSKPVLLWGARGALLPVLLVHVACAVVLRRRNRSARPVPYAVSATVQATPQSRSMIWTGSAILLFVVYHLLHFTVGSTHPEHFSRRDAAGRHDAFAMLVLGFRSPWVSGFYAAAMALLGTHLAHGISSFFQTLGVNFPRVAPLVRAVGPAVAVLIVAGYVSIPLAVLAGWVGGEVQ